VLRRNARKLISRTGNPNVTHGRAIDVRRWCGDFDSLQIAFHFRYGLKHQGNSLHERSFLTVETLLT
jgi:hypothetical protein